MTDQRLDTVRGLIREVPDFPKPGILFYDITTMLKAPEGSADYEALQQLKAHNASLAAEITLRWEAAGLPTERTYLRDAIEAQRRRGD